MPASRAYRRTWRICPPISCPLGTQQRPGYGPRWLGCVCHGQDGRLAGWLSCTVPCHGVSGLPSTPQCPAPSGVGGHQPSFVCRTTLNESLFSTSLRSLGRPTDTPALTPPKASPCGTARPSVRLVLLGCRWRLDIHCTKQSQGVVKVRVCAEPSTGASAPLCRGHGMLWQTWPPGSPLYTMLVHCATALLRLSAALETGDTSGPSPWS